MPQLTSPSSPSLISMRELDPSPVDSPLLSPQSSPSPPSSTPLPPENRNEKHSPPHSSSSPLSSSTTFLGLPKPSLTSTLLLLQKYSTIPFALFLGLHITNTSLLPLLTRDIQTSDPYLLLTRPYYQSPPFEAILILAPLATHVLSGLALRLHRRRLNVRRHGAESLEDRRRIPWPKLSVQSLLGYLFVPLVAGHAFVNRVVPLWIKGDSSGVGLRFVAHGFAKHPLVANVGYALLVGVGSWHFVGGAAKWAGLSEEYVRADGGEVVTRKRRRRRRWVVNGIAALVAGMWMAGGLGVVGRGGRGVGMGWEVRTWDEIYQSVPVFGRML